VSERFVHNNNNTIYFVIAASEETALCRNIQEEIKTAELKKQILPNNLP
jgi:hypothetical protein